MVDRFEIKFDDEQLKNQKGAIRKLYVDLKFLKAQSGFGWNAATGMVTAEKGTWNKLIEAHPKQKFRSLRTMTIHWFDLAAELFDTSMANGEGAVLPGEAPPKDGGDKCSPDLTNSSDLSKTLSNAVEVLQRRLIWIYLMMTRSLSSSQPVNHQRNAFGSPNSTSSRVKLKRL
ncbi:hypothetical protein MJO29_016747 [Puccinia striiformis f. sp. tritici]|nr:hypothetical protein MJO29_016747 [Puccinia striiformis f. sp. tritici]